MTDINPQRDAEEINKEDSKGDSSPASLLGHHFSLSLDMLGVAGFDGYFKHLNDAWTKALGYSLSELYRMPWSKLVHPDDLESVQAAADRLYQGKDVVNFENRCIAKDGSVHWMQWTSKAVIQERLIYTVVHDVTERREFEEKILRLNEDLEKRVKQLQKAFQELETLKERLVVTRDQALEAARLKSDFVANISHEIRTPLSSIIGMTELLLSSNLNEEQKTLATTANESAQSLLAIINDILDFSKIEAGKLQLQLSDFNLQALIQTCVDLFMAQAKQKALQLKIAVDANLPKTVKGDQLRIKQVLLNLISNAIKFTEHGQVSISASLEGENEGNIVVCLVVQDSGMGISPSIKSHLFQPFVQADGTATREHGGTGLGLSISKRLVELMGGEIGVESAQDEGSTFWFTLHLRKAATSLESPLPVPSKAEFSFSPTRKEASPEKSLSNSAILLVEDSPVLQDLAMRQLSKLGYKADLAANGKEAVETVQRHKYDLIFLDVQMPLMDGYEATRLIRAYERSKGSHTTIVAMTAGAMTGDKQKCLDAGMDAYLSKPVSIADLQRVTDAFLKSKNLTFDAEPRKPEQAGPRSKDQEIDLSSLIELYGTDGLGEILRSFFQEANGLFAEITQTLNRKDGRSTTRLAHQLKGLAGIIPEDGLADLAKELKETVEQGEWGKCGKIKQALEERFQYLQLTLSSYLS